MSSPLLVLDIHFAISNPEQPCPERREEALAVERLGDAIVEGGLAHCSVREKVRLAARRRAHCSVESLGQLCGYGQPLAYLSMKHMKSLTLSTGGVVELSQFA